MYPSPVEEEIVVKGVHPPKGQKKVNTCGFLRVGNGSRFGVTTVDVRDRLYQLRLSFLSAMSNANGSAASAAKFFCDEGGPIKPTHYLLEVPRTQTVEHFLGGLRETMLCCLYEEVAVQK